MKMPKRKSPPLTTPVIKLLTTTPSKNEVTTQYTKLLSDAAQTQGVFNIALMGGYCTGKSSALEGLKDYNHEKWYQSTRKRPFRIKTISLLNLRSSPSRSGDSLDSNNSLSTVVSAGSPTQLSDTTQPTLQSKIVEQLYYGEKPSKLRWSKFTRINRSRGRILLLAVALAYVLWELQPLIEAFSGNNIWGIIQVAIRTLLTIILLSTLVFILSKVKIKKLGVEGISAELSDKEPDFSQLVDEIIYFFQATKYNVVVFEDLDRFDNVQIYEDLRQLNFILNQSKQFRQKVVFIYALKDSLITDSSERTKLFEQIIPVVPFMSPFNAKSYLIDALNEVGVSIKNEALISLISDHLQDKRQIDNFANLVALHERLINHESAPNWLTKDETIALALIRQLYPGEYENLQKEAGKIDALYEACQKKQNDVIVSLREKVDQRVSIQSTIKKISPDIYSELKNAAGSEISWADDSQSRSIAAGMISTLGFWQDIAQGRKVVNFYGHDVAITDISDAELKEKAQSIVVMLRHDVSYYQKAYEAERASSAWRYLQNFETDELVPEDLKELLLGLIKCGVLSDSFRSHIAPYHGNLSSQKVLEFMFNNFYKSMPNFDQAFTYKESIEIFSELSKYDLGSPALLNFSLVDAISSGLFQDCGLYDFIDAQGKNLPELIGFYDAYSSYCHWHKQSIQRIAEMTNILFDLYPTEMVECIPKYDMLSDDVDTAYSEIGPDLLRNLSSFKADLPTTVKDYCLERVNEIFLLDTKLAQELFINHKILVDDLATIVKKDARQLIMEDGLFVLNSVNLTHVDEEAPIATMLDEQDVTDEALIDIFQGASCAKKNLAILIDYAFKRARLTDSRFEKDLATSIAFSARTKHIQLTNEQLVLLVDKIEPDFALELVLDADLTPHQFLRLLILLGDPYNRLEAVGKKPSFVNNGLNQKMITRLVGYGVVKKLKNKNNKLRTIVVGEAASN